MLHCIYKTVKNVKKHIQIRQTSISNLKAIAWGLQKAQTVMAYKAFQKPLQSNCVKTESVTCYLRLQTL